ncbi:MAG: DUF4384 domain-containing protein [Bacteroidales bacterium]|nr:DUF4384 domain-containing protein [Bacteroidales bacterium]
MKTVTATGSYVASVNETPAFGKEQALWKAKEEALLEAGVQHDVYSISIIELGGTGDEFREINTQLSRIELDGRIIVKKREEQKPVVTSDNHIQYTVTILAEVVVEETKEDLYFKFDTKGFKNTYLNGEKMTFTVTSTKDCYLRIFYFGKDTTDYAQLYPLEDKFKDVLLRANVSAFFPPEDTLFEYTMEMDDNTDMEMGVVLIVALKKDYPFIGKVTYQNVINWWEKIPRNEKQWEWHGVHIVRR